MVEDFEMIKNSATKDFDQCHDRTTRFVQYGYATTIENRCTTKYNPEWEEGRIRGYGFTCLDEQLVKVAVSHP